jgi:hypothetical protein
MKGEKKVYPKTPLEAESVCGSARVLECESLAKEKRGIGNEGFWGLYIAVEERNRVLEMFLHRFLWALSLGFFPNKILPTFFIFIVPSHFCYIQIYL